ncbi:hypothetical protein BMS3Abin01_01286 [bacterium BMS3Abin01]|nr:hypothetical protein BMS3Abin01_01286 [bacterium BMS3Abin01]HDY69622.1 hypothetical protein [Actinomycetota bacterium]
MVFKTPAGPDPDVATFEPAQAYRCIHEGKWREISKPTRQLMRDLSAGGENVESIYYYWYITCSRRAGDKGFRTVIFTRFQQG